MRRPLLAAGVLVVALAAIAAAPASSPKPALQVRSLAPFSVRGTHFRPFERVHVTLGPQAAPVVRVHASAGGTFVAAFAGVAVERCDGYRVRADGAQGSWAVARARTLMCASTNPG